jgi:hypothetical protein
VPNLQRDYDLRKLFTPLRQAQVCTQNRYNDTNNVPYFATKRGKYNKIDPMYLVTKKKYVCSCGKGFWNENQYKNCRYTHTKQCEVCLRIINTHNGNCNFERHIRSHFHEKVYNKCSKCNLKLKTYEDFCAHRSECLK